MYPSTKYLTLSMSVLKVAVSTDDSKTTPEYRNTLGFSLDTGHLSRSGVDPVATVKLLKGRILSVHLKDVKEAKKESTDLLYGQGISHIAGVLAELKAQGFSGHAAVEYENITDHLLDDVKFCINFIRAH